MKDNNDDDGNCIQLYSKYRNKQLVGTLDREFLHLEERIAKLEKRIGFVTQMVYDCLVRLCLKKK